MAMHVKCLFVVRGRFMSKQSDSEAVFDAKNRGQLYNIYHYAVSEFWKRA